MSCNFRGDLVSLQHMLQRPDSDPQPLRNSQQHQDFIRPITVAMNELLLIHNVHQRFQAQVPPRRQQSRGLVWCGLHRLIVFHPLTAVVQGFHKCPVKRRLDTHPRVGEAVPLVLHILTQGKLHPLRSIRHDLIAGRFAILQFDDSILTANHIRRTMKQTRRGDASR